MRSIANKNPHYVVLLALFFAIIISMIFFLMKNERSHLKDHYGQELSGVVIDIKPFGKGAYQYFVRGKEKVYKISFGGRKNINVNDSVMKEKGDEYFVYRKNDSGHYIIIAKYLY